jgi:hypothetical protein
MGSMGWGNRLRFDSMKRDFHCVLSTSLVSVVTNLNFSSFYLSVTAAAY